MKKVVGRMIRLGEAGKPKGEGEGDEIGKWRKNMQNFIFISFKMFNCENITSHIQQDALLRSTQKRFWEIMNEGC